MPDDGSGRIRVGFLIGLLQIGGIERWVPTVAACLDPARFQVVGTVARIEAGADPAIVERIEAAAGPLGIGPAAARALAAGCDVVLASTVPDVVPGLLGEIPGCKVVAVSHAADVKSAWCLEVLRWTPRADACMAVSRDAARTFPASEQSRVRVIHNIPPRRQPRLTRAAQRAAWGVGLDVPLIGYVGRWSPEKRPTAVLDAVEALPRPWTGVVVGSRPEETRAEAGRRGLAGRMLVPGPTDDPESAMQALDWLLIASPAEGYGLVACEALALGTPVVSTPVGFAAEHPELVVTVPVGADGPTIARAVQADAADDAGRRARIRAGLDLAASHLTPERFGREWGEVIAGLVPRRPPAPIPAVRSRRNGRPYRGSSVLAARLARTALAGRCRFRDPLRVGAGCCQVRCLRDPADGGGVKTLGDCHDCAGTVLRQLMVPPA